MSLKTDLKPRMIMVRVVRHKAELQAATQGGEKVAFHGAGHVFAGETGKLGFFKFFQNVQTWPA